MTNYRFLPRNPDKYAGDPRRIVARSKWELEYMNRLDASQFVRKWMSEPKNLGIRYLNPLDKKIHEYWPDFLIQYVDGNVEIIEIKPLKQAVVEEASGIYDKLSLVKNVAKWQAASRFAKAIGATFKVVTEKTLFQRKSTNQSRRATPPRQSRGTVKR